MRFVIAPDSFKGSASAREVAQAIAEGLKAALPDAVCDLVPMADGGEGTVDALVAATGGRIVSVRVTGPLGEPVDAFFRHPRRRRDRRHRDGSGGRTSPRPTRKAQPDGDDDLRRGRIDAGGVGRRLPSPHHRHRWQRYQRWRGRHGASLGSSFAGRARQ